MRKECIDLLHIAMIQDSDIYVLTADLGFGLFDNIKDTDSLHNFVSDNRFFNVGASEQLMIGMAIGIAEQKKIPVCYSMSSFILYRPFEFLRNYVNYENIPVKLIGSGRDYDYSHDGFSHWAHDDEKVLEALPNIQIYKPIDIKELEDIFQDFLYNNKPSYLNLTRKI